MKKVATNLILVVAFFLEMNAYSNAQFSQQGPKLIGTGAAGIAHQGNSISISSDGNTAIEGGYTDNNGVGAAWIFVRNNGQWIQQGNKLVGTGGIGDQGQGWSVAISSDGNTAIIGGHYDNYDTGAAWIFVRSAGQWSQQGNKLVGTGSFGTAHQGYSVAISGDGNTAIIGGYADDYDQGAVWIFTRTEGGWTQQGSKLVGTGAASDARQGWSVSLSNDGNTAAVGGENDNNFTGATWIFVRTGNVWSQQGSKLLSTDVVGTQIRQGASVSLSGDGNTVIVGGDGDNSDVGAAWVYTRSGFMWTQQGAKLVGTGDIGPAHQGLSVSISYSGDIAIVGGQLDNNGTGAAWIYVRTGFVWAQQGSKMIGTGAAGSAPYQGVVSISSDGSTVLVGGPMDNDSTSGLGALWAYTSIATAITEVNKGQEGLIMYPNPANTLTTINFSSDNENAYSLSVTDMSGRVLKTEVAKAVVGANIHTLNLEGIAKGIYNVELRKGNSFNNLKLMIQ